MFVALRVRMIYFSSYKLPFLAGQWISLSNHPIRDKITADQGSSKCKSRTFHRRHNDNFNEDDTNKKGTKESLRYLGLGGAILFGYYMLCDRDDLRSFFKKVTLYQPIPNMPVLGQEMQNYMNILKAMPDSYRRDIIMKSVSV